MTTYTTLPKLEILQTADELVIRGRKMAVVISLVAVLLLMPFSLRIGYQNIVGNAQVPAIWDRSPKDRIATLLIVLIMVLPLGFGSIAVCFVCLRKRLRPWVFSRQQKKLTRQNQTWPLKGLIEVVVDVRRFYKSGSAGVVLHFDGADTLEVARFHAGSGRAHVSLASRIVVAEKLANTIGEFLQVPVRQPFQHGT